MLHVHLTNQRWCALMKKAATFIVQSSAALPATSIFSIPVLKHIMRCWDVIWMTVRLLIVAYYIFLLDFSIHLFIHILLFTVFCWFFSVIFPLSLLITALMTCSPKIKLHFSSFFYMLLNVNFFWANWSVAFTDYWHGCSFFWVWKYCCSRWGAEWAGDVGTNIMPLGS